MTKHQEDLQYYPTSFLLESMDKGHLTSEKLVERIFLGDDFDAVTVDKDRAILLDKIRLYGKPLGNLHGIPVGLTVPLDGLEDVEDNSTLEDQLIANGAIPVIISSEEGNSRDIQYAAEAIIDIHLSSAVCFGKGHVFIGMASRYGIFGYVPSFGIVSRFGLKDDLAPLYRIGCYANFLEDLSTLGDLISGYDSRDHLNLPYPPPQLDKFRRSKPPVEPVMSSFDLAAIDYQTDYIEDFNLVIDQIGSSRVETVQLHDFTDEIMEIIGIYGEITDAGTIRRELYEEIYRPGEKKSIDANTLNPLENFFLRGGKYFEKYFLDYDCIIMPAVMEMSSSKAICAPINIAAEFCGLPQITIPLLRDKRDNPLGLLLIGKYWEDDRLFRTANWIIQQCNGDYDEEE